MEAQFRTLLLSCLEQSSRGQWGLFGQNDGSEAAKYLASDEAEQVKEIALNIIALREEFGEPNPLVSRLHYYCSLRGANVPGEPKLARAFLQEIQRGDFDHHEPHIEEFARLRL